MIPFLVALMGPLQGKRIPLGESEMTIGRDRTNSVPIKDLLLSRRHCVIRKEIDAYKICDLQSRNGIFVNELPVGECLLEHGDRIEIGSSVFVIALQEEETPSNGTDEDLLNAKVTLSLPMHRQPTPFETNNTSELSLLLRISQSVQSVQKLEEFGEKLLDLLFASIPAQRGSVLVNTVDDYRLLASKTKTGEKNSAGVSRTIANRVCDEKTALLLNDIGQAESPVQSDSLLEYRPQSVLCVPFILNDSSLGIVYLDTVSRSAIFREEDLRLAGSIATIVAPALKNLQDLEIARIKNDVLQKELLMKSPIIGESSAIRKVREVIEKTSRTDTCVLITGESGTGKELAARTIHSKSSRANHPFVTINWAAIPNHLLESELFGYEKGAFEGAIFSKKGKIETASGGTLFFDEVAELPLTLQAKVLRVLEEKQIERVGSSRPAKIDVRIFAATNRDLRKCMQDGTFRSDLFYRLNVVSLKMPALREMEEDILLLARYFASHFSTKAGHPFQAISPEAQTILRTYNWPGNIRELQNAMERAIVLGSSETIHPDDLPELLLESRPSDATVVGEYQDALQNFKKEFIRKALETAGGNYNEAASRLGLHTNHLYRLVRNFNLSSVTKKKEV